MNFVPYLEGLALAAGLIMAIGAQNAFVLKQGIKRQYLFLTAFTCFICDSILIVAGISGFGAIFRDLPILMLVLRYAGAAFLIVYGIRSFINVFRPHVLIASLENDLSRSWFKTLMALLAFTFLNPHTYIDTVLILGSVGAERPPNEILPFIMGSLTASFLWFFGLTYGASLLSPVFKNPRAWQILDTLTGCIMLGIAATLLY